MNDLPESPWRGPQGRLARVVLLHAHPDDETLATGALIAGLVADGHPVAVVTATRGERGEAMPELATLAGEAFVEQREYELRQALAALGVTAHAWLGAPPARAAGRTPRRYSDSGMRWLTPTQAGPGDDADATALSLAPVAEAAADLTAFLAGFDADVVISYDAAGGYHHPDHVACHHIARAAAAAVRFVEIASDVSAGTVDPGEQVVDRPDQADRLWSALSAYRSQFRVGDGEVVHVGGQHQQITTACRLRPSH